MLVVNKCDNDELASHAAEFSALGLGDPVLVSSIHRVGIHDVFRLALMRAFGTEELVLEDPDEKAVRLAVIAPPSDDVVSRTKCLSDLYVCSLPIVNLFNN
jgi:predicted GTPase